MSGGDPSVALGAVCLDGHIQNFGSRNLACMIYQIKSICNFFSQMSVIWRDESNEPNLVKICYSDATITFH